MASPTRDASASLTNLALYARLSQMDPAIQTRLVLLTRAAGSNAYLARLLGARSIESRAVPLIRIESLLSTQEAQAFLATAKAGDVLALTSANALRALWDALGVDALIGHLANLRIAVVGDKTAAICLRLGLSIDLIAPDANAASLGALLVEQLDAGTQVFVPQSTKARPELVARLKVSELLPVGVAAYATEANSEGVADFWSVIRRRQVAAVVFFSPSAVRAAVTGVEADLSILRELFLFSIGPTTSQALRQVGLNVLHECETPSSETMATLVAAQLGDAPTG